MLLAALFLLYVATVQIQVHAVFEYKPVTRFPINNAEASNRPIPISHEQSSQFPHPSPFPTSQTPQ
jgi:hypothetical protein